MTEKKLTPKQQAFVNAYTGPARGNATEAARMAGYKGSPNTLRVVGAENLTKPAIAEAIHAAESITRSRAIADREEIQELLTSIARGEGLEPHVLQSGEVVHTEPTFAVRMGSAMNLAKMRGYLIERIEVKAVDQMRGQLERLQKRMPPDAFEALLEAIAEGDGAG